MAALLLGAVASGTGFLLVRNPVVAGLLFLVPVTGWLLLNRLAAALLLAATLALTTDVSGGAAGLNVALSDVLLSLLGCALLVHWATTRAAPELAALRPLRLVVGQYLAALLVLLMAHLGVAELVKTGQRIELFAFPLLVGAALALQGRELWVLRAYVVGVSVVAVLWIGGVELGQKNPTGQFLADGIILLLASAPLRRRLFWLMPVLVAGVLWTQSRGAILSVGVGLSAVLITQPGRSRARSAMLAIPLAAASFVAFKLLPEDAQLRNLTYTAGTGSRAAYAIKIREQYQVDAWQIIHANRGIGVGVGQYHAGTVAGGTITGDPHQVLLLQLAEGGYGFAGCFVVLVLGAAVVLWRVARTAPLGTAAVALGLAIAAHGLVDVYWVRGTPVLGWLVIGMALGQRHAAQRGQPPRPSRAAAERSLVAA